jgi:hypothetical protein
MDKKKKDLKLVLALIVTAIIGLVHMIFNGNKELLFAYVLLVIFAIPVTYFSYSLGKMGNRWENIWKEKNPGSGEPSSWLVISTKASGWFAFICAMVFALIPKL